MGHGTALSAHNKTPSIRHFSFQHSPLEGRTKLRFLEEIATRQSSLRERSEGEMLTGRGSAMPDQGLKARSAYALATFPLLMQDAHTRSRLGAPLTSALTTCRFTFQRRRVTLCACEMLLPNCGPLPQISQTCAMVELQNLQGLSAPPKQLAHTRNPASSPCRIFSIAVWLTSRFLKPFTVSHRFTVSVWLSGSGWKLLISGGLNAPHSFTARFFDFFDFNSFAFL